MDPFAFEKLVLGYAGYGIPEHNQITQKTRDKGLDGIIHEDRLGLGKIGLQVKRYGLDHSVGAEHIHSFLGALARHGLGQGFFVTSSQFSGPAKEAAAENRSSSLVLISGEKLAQLMLEYDLGIQVKKIMKISELDEGFFNSFED